MLRALLPAVLLLVSACSSDIDDILDEIDAFPRATESTGGTSSAASTMTGDGGEDLSHGVMTSTDGGADASDTGASAGETGATGEVGSGGNEMALPEIVVIELPAEVHTAGPVPISVHTKNTVTVRVTLDGVDMGELAGAGKDVFVGEFVVKGEVDNGTHQVEVIAVLGGHEDSEQTSFAVNVPAGGKPAWVMPGAPGTRTHRIALTADGDVIEAGSHIGADLPRPAMRKRSGVDGADLWGKKVLLSALEGHVADVAIAPDGGIWVVMNVKEANQQWRPHILLLTPDGTQTGVDRPGIPGATMRAIAADDEGGCFAVGYAVVEGGDLDVFYQGVNAAGTGTVLDTWDYRPNGLPHEFADVANDVAIDGDVAWLAGLSVGKHNKFEVRTRGLLVRLDVHTGEVLGPVTIAPASEDWRQSMFFGVTLHDAGIVVAGAGCPDVCGDVQRVEVSRYDAAGDRTWHQTEMSAKGAYGSEVVVVQGQAIVAGASKQDGVLRGQAFARTIGDVQNKPPLWEHWFPASKEASEALTVARDTYDRIFIDGYITTGGTPQAWLVQLSP